MSRTEFFLPPLREEEEEQLLAPTGYNLDRLLGLEEEVPEDFNALLSLLAGVGVGAAEPLTLIPQVGDAVDRLRSYRAPDDELINKITYGLGWFAGSLIPGSAAFKLGGLAARGLGLTSKALKAGDTVADLTRMGRLVRGGVAGAAYTVGMDADSPADWAKRVALDAALFGVGDVVLDPVIRAVSSRIFRAPGKPLRAEDITILGVIEDAVDKGVETDESTLLARSMQVIDDIIEREAAVPIPRTPERAAVPSQALLNHQSRAEKLRGSIAELDAMRVPDFEYSRVFATGSRELGKDPRTGKRFKTWRDKAVFFAEYNEKAATRLAAEEAAAIPAGPEIGPAVQEDVTELITSTPQRTAERRGPGALQEGIFNLSRFESIEKRKLGLQLGIEELGLEEVRGGIMKIVPIIGADADDVKRVAKQLDDFVIQMVERTTQRGRKVQDAIIGRRSQFDYRIADEYRKFGFVQGQEVIWKGKKRIIVKGVENADFVLGYLADNPAKKLHRIPKNEMHILPILHSRAVPGLPDPGKWVVKFIQERGEFHRNFGLAFREFADQYAIHGKAAQDLKLLILRRQRSLAKAIDPEMIEALERVGKTSGAAIKKVHPERKMDVLASEKGFVRDWVYDPETDSWIVLLVDHKNGNKMRFKSQTAAEEFLLNYGVEPPPLVQGLDSPIGIEALSEGIEGGAAVQVAHSAVEASNFNPPISWLMSGPIAPREAHVRGFENIIRSQGIESVTFKNNKGKLETIGINLWSGNVQNGVVVGGFDRVRHGINIFRNEMNGLWAPEGREKIDWTEWFYRIRGGKGKNSRIRREVHESWDLVFESKRANWESLNEIRKSPVGAYNAALKAANDPTKDLIRAARELTDDEWKALGEMREIWNALFDRAVIDPNIKITGDDFIEDYFPHILRKSAGRWSKSVEQALQKKGKTLSTNLKDFIHEMERTGQLTRYEKDPYIVLSKYMRGLFFRSHVTRHWKETARMVNGLQKAVEQGKAPHSMGLVARSMADYLQMVHGGLPESYYAVSLVAEKVFDDLGIKLGKASFDRLVNTLVSANYGAFLGFRIGPAVRNLTQLLVVTLPRVGAKNLAKGIEQVMKNPQAALDELRKMGVLVERAVPVASEDAVFARVVYSQVEDAIQGKQSKSVQALEKLMQLGEKVTQVSTFSLGGEVTVAGKKIPIGLFGKMDEFNRAVSVFAQKAKTIEAINNWKQKGWSVDRFNDAAGLTQFGETVTAEFHRRMTTSQDDAINFVSGALADDTQWIYELGAGPPMFAHGLGRLFGMYGTWPIWFGTHLFRGMSRGTTKDKVRFLGWSAATTAAFSNAAYFTGVNLSRWTGLSSFEWAGSPFLDWFKDFTTVWTGVQETGEPTAGRELALSQRGLDDIGPEGLRDRFGAAAGLVSALPGSPAQVSVSDPGKLFMNTIGMFTPGAYLMRDILQASREVENEEYGRALAEMLSLTMSSSVGGTWPEMDFR